MNFKSDASRDGALVYGYADGWHWSKNKGDAKKGRDFFWVHWEIGEDAPNSVKLHVESPRATDDAELNAIKREMVEAFLAVRFQSIVEAGGYLYKAGTRTKPEHIQKNKCTSPFHVLLTPEQSQNDERTDIEAVHCIAGEAVCEVVQRFETRLRRHFEN